jgi:2-polyprenyl-3-methyl-5-hydroxy-6-metoxy-1,4-benzoquinol methylase
MSREPTGIYRDGTYGRKHPAWHEEDAPYKAKDILRLLRKHGIKPATVCEVGCGSGGILELLAREFGSAQCTGFDISEQALALCRPKAGKNLLFLPGSLPERDAHFDLVLAIDVFEHVEDYIGFLKELRPKGTYTVFRVPLNLSVQSVLSRSRPILSAREAYGHLHYFTRETALATLRDAGYRIVDSFLTFSPISIGALGPGRALLKSLKYSCFRLMPAWVARMLDGFSLMVLAQ